jgi:hypothetical protein
MDDLIKNNKDSELHNLVATSLLASARFDGQAIANKIHELANPPAPVVAVPPAGAAGAAVQQAGAISPEEQALDYAHQFGLISDNTLTSNSFKTRAISAIHAVGPSADLATQITAASKQWSTPSFNRLPPRMQETLRRYMCPNTFSASTAATLWHTRAEPEQRAIVIGAINHMLSQNLKPTDMDTKLQEQTDLNYGEWDHAELDSVIATMCAAGLLPADAAKLGTRTRHKIAESCTQALRYNTPIPIHLLNQQRDGLCKKHYDALPTSLQKSYSSHVGNGVDPRTSWENLAHVNRHQFLDNVLAALFPPPNVP